jgi:hypothetical protein
MAHLMRSEVGGVSLEWHLTQATCAGTDLYVAFKLYTRAAAMISP